MRKSIICRVLCLSQAPALLLLACDPSLPRCASGQCVGSGALGTGGAAGASCTVSVGTSCPTAGSTSQVWRALSASRPTGTVDNVAFDPREPTRVYATARTLFYRSDDRGQTWIVVSQLPDRVGALSFPHQRPGTILAASDIGVIESSDYGSTWFVKSLNGLTLRMLLVHPADDRMVLAAMQYEGLFRSLDGGNTWLDSNRGVPTASFDGLAGDPINPARAWASLEMADEQGAMATTVIETTDAGWSWHARIESTTGTLRGLAQCASNPSHLFAGAGKHLEVSRDAGNSWSKLELPNANTDAIAIGGRDCGSLYVPSFLSAYEAVLFRSTDGGLTFQSSFTKGMEVLHAPYARQLAFDPADPTHLLAATEGGLFQSTDGAERWELVPGVGALVVNQMLARPKGHEILAVTWGAGVWRWRADTSHWAPVPSQDGFSDHFLSIASSPTDPNRILLGSWGKTLLSEDGGTSYSVVNDQDNAYAFAFAPANSGEVLAATHWSGVLHSVDSGRTWQASANGIAPMTDGSTYPGARFMRSVVYSPDGKIYLGAENRGVFSSIDSGLNWSVVQWSAPGASVRCLLGTTDGVYACTDSLGVAKLAAGTSQFVTDGLESLEITGLTQDLNGTVYLTSNGGVFTRGANDSWIAIPSNGLPSLETSSPIIYRDGGAASLIVASPFGIYSHEL